MTRPVPAAGVYRSARRPDRQLEVLKAIGDDPDALDTWEQAYIVTVRLVDDAGVERTDDLCREDWEAFAARHELMHVGPLP